MAFNINLFAGALKFGGARPSLFQVNITNPANAAADIQVPLLVRAAQIPAATLGINDVPYFGRQLRIAGNRKKSWIGNLPKSQMLNMSVIS